MIPLLCETAARASETSLAALLMPGAALLLGIGVLAFAVLRRR